MQKIFSIAIDGPAGAGKSTIAKALAKALNAMYLDTGAMYRAVGLYMLRNGISVNDAKAVASHMDAVDISVGYEDGVQRMYLAGEDVSDAIRTPECSMAASKVSAVPAVRQRLVALQRQIAQGHSVVMDGRDIGTYVLPHATLKIYLTASVEVRAQRRQAELAQRGDEQPYEKVLSEMIDRDFTDMNREASPLRPAEDAHRVDNSHLTLEQVIDEIRTMALEVIEDLK